MDSSQAQANIYIEIYRTRKKSPEGVDSFYSNSYELIVLKNAVKSSPLQQLSTRNGTQWTRKNFYDIASISVSFIEEILMRCIRYATFRIQLESSRRQILAFTFVMGMYEGFLVPLGVVEEIFLDTKNSFGFRLWMRMTSWAHLSGNHAGRTPIDIPSSIVIRPMSLK